MKKNNLLLIAILAINVLLRIPSLLEPVSYGDECIYLTLGNALNKGLVFYRDIHDNKPPLLYLVAAIANANLFWLRWITIVWNTVNVLLIYQLAKKLIKKESAALIAATLFAYFSLIPEGRIANGEIFMIMPATLGVLLAIKAKEKKKNIFWFLSGFCFSLAFLFKVPIAFDFGGFLLAVFLFPTKKIKDIFLLVKDKGLYLVLIGFFLPIILTIIYYSQKGAFTPYVRSALLQNIGYLASWGGSNWGLYQRLIILVTVAGLFYLWRKRLGFSYWLPALMTIFGLFGAFLSERPYPHYLIEIAPWAALLFAVLLFQKKTYQLITSLLLIFLTVFGFYRFDFWWYANLPYYKNFARFALGKIQKEQYLKYFGEKVFFDYQVSDYLKKHTSSKERVFVWGDGACIYASSRRLPPGRYTVNYHIFDFDGFEETIAAIKERQPKIVVKLLDEKRRFLQLESLLKKEYTPIKKTKKAIIFQKI